MRALRFGRSPILWLTVTIFTLGSFPALQAFKLQNPSLIAAALIAITLYLLSANHLLLGGVFLAASTFKPQFTIALILWLAFWAAADWRKRRSLAWSFLATMLALGAISERLVPGWIPSFLHVIRAYGNYTYGHSLLDVWLTPTFGPFASASLMVAGLALTWRCRTLSADSPRFFLATSLMLAANVLVIPTLAPHAQLLLVPGFLCLLPAQARFWTSNPAPRVLQVAAWALLAWPWMAAFGLLLAAFRYPATTLLRFWELPLYTSPLSPLAVVLALASLLFANPGSIASDAPFPGLTSLQG
jgi:hypothetical protein